MTSNTTTPDTQISFQDLIKQVSLPEDTKQQYIDLWEQGDEEKKLVVYKKVKKIAETQKIAFEKTSKENPHWVKDVMHKQNRKKAKKVKTKENKILKNEREQAEKELEHMLKGI